MSYITSKKKNILLFLITIGIINTLLAIVTYFYMNNKQYDYLYKSKLDLAQLEFEKTNEKLNNEINHYKLILNTLKENKDLKRFLDKEKNIYPYLVEDYFDFLKANNNIEQLRFIDEKGNEQIRLDKKDGNIINVKNLQNKRNRYYFKRTISLKENETYISNLDLNVENDEIEIPYKPTIRVSTPIYNKEILRGILIINFNAKELINTIKNKRDFDVYYMDNKDNFLLHPDNKKNWSTQLGNNYKVKDEIKNINWLVNNNKINKKAKDKNNIFYLYKIDITDDDFFIIYSIKKEIYDKYMEKESKDILMFFLYVFILSVPFVLLGAYMQSIRMNILDSLINNIPFPICLKDKEGRFLIVNDSLVKLYGYTSKKHLLGKSSYDFEHNNLPCSSIQKDKEVIEKNKIRSKDSVIINDKKKIYYDTRIIKISFFGILNKIYILGIAIDITDIKILNDKLKEKVNEEVNKRLSTEKILIEKTKLAEMGNMIDNIIHQWKQPLSVIKVTSQALEFNEDIKNLSDKQKKEYLQTIIENVNFMSETADDFRNFLSSDKVKSTFLIHQCINKIYKILFFRFKKNNTNFINNTPIDLAIDGYKSEFCQVILNILNNALDQFESKKIENQQIMIDTTIHNNYIVINIEDNAGGIEKENISKIFDERFSSKKENGTGIGLTICKKIIKKSFEGDIQAENKNNGACFNIRISTNI